MPTRPELVGDLGMVASTHWIASAVGMGVLERGGNAADAAVAAGFALQVVEPHLNGPGGDLPILLWDPAAAAVRVVCGQGVAPASATVAAMRSRGVDTIPGTGLLAAVVPGAFGGWLTLLAGWGTWSLADVLEPAITLAERGHPLLPTAAATINALRRPLPPGLAELGRSVADRGTRPGGRVSGSATRCSRRRTAGWWPRARPPVRTARRRSRPPGGPGTRASWPRRSTASVRGQGGLLTGQDLASWAAGGRGTGDRDLRRRDRGQDRTVGSGSGDAAAARVAGGRRTRRARSG